MFRSLITAAALAALAVPVGAVAAAPQGAAPQTVDLNVPCQGPNHFNCTWYGKKISPRQATTAKPSYTDAFWVNFTREDGSYCRYRLVPTRALKCGAEWPLQSF
jgi:hypothetical protein